MIKAEVNLVGTVKKAATMRTDKNGKPYLSFVMSVNVQDGTEGSKEMEILVTMSNAKKNDVQTYVENRRLVVLGTLNIRHKGERLAFYLSANKLSTKDVGEQDSITGEMQFRGRLRNENVMEEKTDKKGNPYLTFSAFSSEKVDDNFVSTWVRFMRFPAKGENIESIKPDWMQPKARISVQGDLQVGIYNDTFRFNCIVKDMQEYIPEPKQQ